MAEKSAETIKVNVALVAMNDPALHWTAWQLPDDTHVHPLFHASKVKAFIGKHIANASFTPNFLLEEYDFVSAPFVLYLSIWQGDDSR